MLHEEITIKQRITGVSAERKDTNIGGAEGEKENRREGRQTRTEYNTHV